MANVSEPAPVMVDQPDSDRLALRLQWIPLTASAAAMLVGGLVLVGWWFDIGHLTSLSPHWVSMTANTALAFVLTGAALWLLRTESPNAWNRRVAQVCASIVALIGLLTLSEYLFGWDLGIDHLLVTDLHAPTEPYHLPGRIAFASALNFLLLGAALLLLDVTTYRGFQPAPYLVMLASVSGFVTLVAYLYGGSAIHQAHPFTTVAPHAAALFIALATGVLFARARHRLVCVLSGETVTAAAMRRLLIVAILLPISAGWVRLRGEQLGFFGTEFGLALIVVFAIATLSASIYWQAATLIRAEAYQRGINEVAVLLSRSIMLEDVFPGFAATIKEIVPCDRICVVMREGEKLVAAASFADPPLECFQGRTWRPSGETAVEWVMVHKLPRLTRDLPREIAFADEAFVAQEGVHSTLILPLLVGGEAVGSLTLDSRTPGAFTQDHVSILTGFTEPLASSVRNSDLHSQVVRYAHDLEGLVEERTRELQVANGHLVEASRHKSNFLTNMSHELRTPLNSILGFADLLGDQIGGSLTPKQLRYLDHICTAGTHLLTLINDLLDLSKVEAGKLTLRPEPFDLSEALAAAVQEIQPLADTKQLTLTLDIETAPITLIADPVRFKQVMHNLLSNAVKFTPEDGRITVTARHDPHHDHFVDIVVTDTGIGIAVEDLSRLFTRFTQLETETTKRFQGTGLGLALIKQLVELHGGTIAVASAGPGQGAAFTIRLPLTPQVSPTP